ncbi:MAG: hypothetical protein H6742_14905 [Alphaproteobacteria bacterium]|nr:hypothetical protein [Alphaproteobacteria bacterium]
MSKDGATVETLMAELESRGEALGMFRDDPVSKGCTSPFVPRWVAELVERQG